MLLVAECTRIFVDSSITLIIHIQYVSYDKFDHVTCWYFADFEFFIELLLQQKIKG